MLQATGGAQRDQCRAYIASNWAMNRIFDGSLVSPSAMKSSSAVILASAVVAASIASFARCSSRPPARAHDGPDYVVFVREILV